MLYKHKTKSNCYCILPITSIISLLVISIIILNPSISISKTYADGGNDNGYVVYDVDNSVTTYDLTEDGVVLEWDNRDSDYQTITGSNSEVLYRYNRFRVTAENIKKYQILANIADTANGTNGNKLIGYTNSEYNIPNGYSIDSISDANGIVGKDLTSSTTSQWGYAITIGEVTTTDNLSNLTYKAVPSAASSDIGLTDNVTELNNQAFTIAFAANIADDKPAGSYRASVGVSVVVEPKPLTAIWSNGVDSGIKYMQEMTSSVCNGVTTPAADTANNPTITLEDARDSNKYTVTKFKDGNCWMTQNLRLVGPITLTSTNSDINISYDLPASTSINSSDNPKHFTRNDRYISLLHYANNDTYGAYYNWYTATAGAGDANITNSTITDSSICPKGWQLPIRSTYAYDNTKSYYKLLLNIPNSSTGSSIVRSMPYNFVYSGLVSESSLNGIGSEGYYWSSTAYEPLTQYVINASHLFISSDLVIPSNGNDRYNGFAIRCVAR